MKSTAMGTQTTQNDEEEGDNTKSPADTTTAKVSTGKQADSLDNPDKSKTVDSIKGKK